MRNYIWTVILSSLLIISLATFAATQQPEDSFPKVAALLGILGIAGFVLIWFWAHYGD